MTPLQKAAQGGKVMTDTSKRAELIDCLREYASFKCIEGNEKRMVLQAADMLESDAGWEQVARAQDAKLHAMLGKPGGIEKLSEVLGKAKAQQVAVPAGCVPMTPVEIIRAVRKVESIWKLIRQDDVTAFTRAIETHHGITPQGDKT